MKKSSASRLSASFNSNAGRWIKFERLKIFGSPEQNGDGYYYN